MTEPVNELLRDHVTSAAFVLTLGKTHVAELVRIDLELAAEVRVDNRKLGKLHRCDMTARHGLAARGLIVWVWPANQDKWMKAELGWDGKPTGRMVRDLGRETPPGEHWNITRAGRLVCDLLKEAGLYQEHAGSILPLIESVRERRRSA